MISEISRILTKASASVAVCPCPAPVVKARVCDMVAADRNNKFREAQTPVPDARTDAIPRNTGVARLRRGVTRVTSRAKFATARDLRRPSDDSRKRGEAFKEIAPQSTLKIGGIHFFHFEVGAALMPCHPRRRRGGTSSSPL